MSIIGTHRITIGDTLLPLNTVLRHGNGDPIDLSAYTVTVEMETDAGVSELAETATGVTVHPTQAFTVDTTTYHVKCVGHGLKDGDQVKVASTTTLPTGLAASTPYFVRDVSPNAFKLETVPGGGVLPITGAGSGTHTFWVIGSVQMDFAAANVDTAGLYRLWFILTSSAEKKHIPEKPTSYFQISVNV